MAMSEKDSSDGGDNPALGLNWQVSRWDARISAAMAT